MEEIGRVVEIKKKKAIVRLNRNSACEHCNLCGLTKRDKFIDIEIDNKKNAKLGNEVVVSMSDGNVIKAATIVYVVPLLLAIIGLFVASILKMGEKYEMIFAGIGILVGAVFIIIMDRRLKKTGFNPKITKIISYSSGGDENGRENNQIFE